MTYVIGTAGHVDHGKSRLVEALTGIDPDRLAEEKEREMTIDLGFAWVTLPSGKTVGVVDVPGHRDFIENMLAGVGGIDLALLVIAADEGVMPQTREHLAILDLLEVPGGIIALSKTDLIHDPDWLELVMLDVEEVLTGTVLADAPIVPVSARTGEGLDDLLGALDHALEESTPRGDRGRPRLPVDRVFTVSGFGTVVTGTLLDGSLSLGDEIEIVPKGLAARVRGLQSHQETIEEASPGNRVAVNLSGVDKEDIQRGDVVAAPGILDGTTLIDVQFRHLESAGRALKHNVEVKFFSGAAETPAHVRLVGDQSLAPGRMGWLQLRLANPVALQKGDRFILRYPSPPQTIGGGIVLDPHPPHRWRRFKDHVIERFETLAAGTPDEVLLHALEEQVALTYEQAAAQPGLSPEEVDQAIEALAAHDEIIILEEQWLMAPAGWSRVVTRTQNELMDYHRRFPLRLGMPREALRSRLKVGRELFSALMELAAATDTVVDEGTVLRLPSHAVTFSEEEEAAIEALFGQIRADATSPPSVKDAVGMVGEEVFEALIAQGDLVKVSEDVIFDRDTYEWMVNEVIQYIEAHGAITVAEARDHFNTSRKYVLGLLEHLDGAGITRRVEDRRVLRRPVG